MDQDEGRKKAVRIKRKERQERWDGMKGESFEKIFGERNLSRERNRERAL